MRLSFLGLLVTLAVAPLADAQTVAPPPETASRASSCTYDVCALRIEPGVFGVSLVRGRDGAVVDRGVFFGPDIESAVTDSPLALDHARAYAGARRRSALSVLAAVVLLTSVDSFNTTDEARVGVALGSLGLAVYGSVEAVRAQREASRAIWEYNATLDRSP